jgi:hypothetical protein
MSSVPAECESLERSMVPVSLRIENSMNDDEWFGEWFLDLFNRYVANMASKATCWVAGLFFKSPAKLPKPKAPKRPKRPRKQKKW